jgi:hypothetical protein
MLVTVVLASFAGESAAHPASLRVMGRKGAQGQLKIAAFLDPPHSGSRILMRVYKMKDGVWTEIISASLPEESPGVYRETFDAVRGDSRCKVKGRFKRANHATVKDWSPVFDC